MERQLEIEADKLDAFPEEEREAAADLPRQGTER